MPVELRVPDLERVCDGLCDRLRVCVGEDEPEGVTGVVGVDVIEGVRVWLGDCDEVRDADCDAVGVRLVVGDAVFV